MLLHIGWLLLQLVTWVSVAALVGVVGVYIGSWVEDFLEHRRRTREAEIEVMLDRKQLELRATILNLADALAEERQAAGEASAEMLRAAYLTRGQLP